MKKLLFSLTLVGSLAAFAGESTVDASAQVYGVLPVYSTDTNVIVAVPWVAVSNTATNSISVADIIKTSNLTAGDWIRVWPKGTTNNSFKVWTLVSNEQTHVQTWAAANTVSAMGVVNVGSPSSDTYLERGEALVLHRQNPGTFYVCGQYLSSSAEGVTCAKAQDVDGQLLKAFTMIAPPAATNTYINNFTWSNVGVTTKGSTSKNDEVSDYLTLGVRKTEFVIKQKTKTFMTTPRLYFDSEERKWVEYTSTGKETDHVIPAGTGIWYTSCVTNGAAASVAW